MGLLRRTLLAASRDRRLRALARRGALGPLAGRFVAGTTLDDFVTCARAQNAAGARVAAGYLGEGVGDEAAAYRIATDFCAILDRIAGERLDATVAVKLTHLGLALDRTLAEANAARVVAHAERLGLFVRFDMEESYYVDATLEIYRRLRAAGHTSVGIVLQAMLHRSLDDLAALAPLEPNIRLVKGAYQEPATIAHAKGPATDGAFRTLIAAALGGRGFVAVATHDAEIIAWTRARIAEDAIARERYEFQTLLGVRRPLVESLIAAGEPVRVSVPFGDDWYPYLMRRMAENPANLVLIARNLLPSRA